MSEIDAAELFMAACCTFLARCARRSPPRNRAAEFFYGERMFDLMEEAATWADLKGVDYSFFRDGGEWTMQMRFSDANGPYVAFFQMPETSKDIGKKLNKCCVDAHKARHSHPRLITAKAA